MNFVDMQVLSCDFHTWFLEARLHYRLFRAVEYHGVIVAEFVLSIAFGRTFANCELPTGWLKNSQAAIVGIYGEYFLWEKIKTSLKDSYQVLGSRFAQMF